MRMPKRTIAEIILAIPRSCLIDCLTNDQRVVVKNTANPDHLSDDALRLLCVLTIDLGKSEFEPGMVPSALCSLYWRSKDQKRNGGIGGRGPRGPRI